MRMMFEVGCSLPLRDSVDNRIVADMLERKGKIIDEPGDVGGYPEY